MRLTFREYVGPEIASVINDLARLRVAVFRDWPYLYDGDAAYEREYLARYAKENRKYASQIQRTYYSVISDAIEGCFAFDLEAEEFAFDNMLSENADYSEYLAQAMDMEEKILAFYTKAAEQSMSLMADVPRSFKIVVKKRKDRIPTLKSLS